MLICASPLGATPLEHRASCRIDRAFFLSRFLSSVLFGITVHGPRTFVAVPPGSPIPSRHCAASNRLTSDFSIRIAFLPRL